MTILRRAFLGSLRIALFGSLKAALFVYALFLSDTPFAGGSYDAAANTGSVNVE